MKKVNFRKIELESGTKILLGKNDKNNDELMRKFKGKKNTIIHTLSPGSPFCVIESNLNPSKQMISTSGAICASYSQDWRDNKSNAIVNVFTGKDIKKERGMKKGTWGLKIKPKKLLIKKNEIKKSEKKYKNLENA